MPAPILDSLTLKVHSFLTNVGVSTDPAQANATALMSYFEKEYGLSIMAFLEREWLREQLGRDELSEEFMHARELLDPDRRRAFDEDVTFLLSR